MITEKQIRDAIGKDLLKYYPRDDAIRKLKSLDTHLDILEIAESDGINAPEAWQAITDAVQEPDDFWDYCVQWAYKATGEPDIKLYPMALLVKLMATDHGIKALREAQSQGY